MGTSNKEFRFGTIAGIRPGFPFPCFNHLKYFPGLPESIIEKLNNKIKKEVRKCVHSVFFYSLQISSVIKSKLKEMRKNV